MKGYLGCTEGTGCSELRVRKTISIMCSVQRVFPQLPGCLYIAVSALKILDVIWSTAHYSFHTFTVLGKISLASLKFFVLKSQFTFEVNKKPLRAEFEWFCLFVLNQEITVKQWYWEERWSKREDCWVTTQSMQQWRAPGLAEQSHHGKARWHYGRSSWDTLLQMITGKEVLTNWVHYYYLFPLLY